MKFNVIVLRPACLLDHEELENYFRSAQDLQYVALGVEAPSAREAGKLALTEAFSVGWGLPTLDEREAAMKRHTCDKCKHFSLDPSWVGSRYEDEYANKGSCALILDISDRPEGKNPKDACSAWDHESYSAGAYVGPKFGCIHWEKKIVAGSPGEPAAPDTDKLTKE